MKTHTSAPRSWYLALSLLALAAVRLALAQDPNSFSTVTIHATDPLAREGGVDTGTFTVRRTGPTNVPLAVFYHLSGSAFNGVDYVVHAAALGRRRRQDEQRRTLVTAVPEALQHLRAHGHQGRPLEELSLLHHG